MGPSILYRQPRAHCLSTTLWQSTQSTCCVKDLERARKEVLRLNLGKDPNGRFWETARITELKEKMSTLRTARVKMDPSGGVNYSRAGIAAPFVVG